MVKEDRSAWKANYFLKLVELFEEYPKCLLVGVDNVGSKQMQEIRAHMRGKAEILMGKNTMIRKAIRGHLQKNPDLEKLLPHIVGNVGFVFTKNDLSETRDILLENKRVRCPRQGRCHRSLRRQDPSSEHRNGTREDLVLPGPPDPHQDRPWYHRNPQRGPHHKEGEKVGASESALLNMMNIQPFAYGLVVQQVYDNGAVYSPAVLDMTTEELRKRFMEGVRNVAAVSLAIGRPTLASAPHMVANAFKNLMAVAAETDVTFKEAEQVKEYLADPSKFAAAAPAAAAPAAAAAAPAAAPAKEESESDSDIGLGLFD
ncbi:hypothetical protein L596_015768 [Steinernema carpocapsae]|uniref:60S acidic ribosomal protein P0 n=1 Tax=Steinernema carpocapsae TaxID=34508 RepID=A0A4U5NFY7_STECR|nr:hypothetical protein L596_015768 [Steinernema carpocapsae]